MKKYVALSSAMLMGTVVSRNKTYNNVDIVTNFDDKALPQNQITVPIPKFPKEPFPEDTRTQEEIMENPVEDVYHDEQSISVDV
jgi:hypothetical protein